MKQLIVLQDLLYGKKVGSAGPITNINDLDSLQNGALGIFVDQNDNMVTTSNVAAIANDKEYVWFADGRENAVLPVRRTGFVTRQTAKISYQTYAAGVAQRSFLGYDGTDAATAMNYIATAAIYDSYGINIWDASIADTDVLGRYNYSVEAVSASETQDALITRLVAKINADVNRIVTATKVGSGTGIQLDRRATGSPSVATGKPFKFVGTGGLVNATKTYTNAQCLVPKDGVGDYNSMVALENAISAYNGNRGIEPYKQDFYNPTSRIAASTNYDMITINWTKAVGREVSAIDFENGNRTIWIAYPNGSSLFLIATIKTIFGELFTSTAADTEVGGS